MYLSEVEEIFAYWERSPPVYQMVSIIAQMLGWHASGSGTASRSVRASSDDQSPLGLLMTGVFAPAPNDVARELSALARMATSGSA